MSAAISPGRAAWRRLRRSPAAMFGLGWMLLIVLACLIVPLLTPHAPDRELPWLGALPPGSTAPDAAWENVFTLGEAPRGSAGLVRRLRPDSQIELTVVERHDDEIQVRLRRGLVHRILRTEGAQRLPELDLDDPGLVAHSLREDGRPDRRMLGHVVEGQLPPRGFFLPGERALVLAVAAAGGSTPRHHSVQLQAGRVVAIDGGATSQLEIAGDELTALRIDGRELRARFVLGTDSKGRDVLARVLYGGRVSLAVGLVATVVSVIIGVFYGAIAGYAGGRTDRLMMAAVDVLYGLPFMFLVIMLLVAFGRNILVLFAALGAVQWLTMARIVRGQTLSLRVADFVAAARLAGAGPWHILRCHIVPNCLGPVAVYASLTVPLVILEESFLAFLGLGVEWQGRALDSWGALVAQGMNDLGTGGERAWLLIVPATTMALTLLALNLLGDGLRDALDPRLEGRS